MRRAWAAALATGAVVAAPPVGAQQPSSLLERPARLTLASASLEEALGSLQRSSGVSLAYSPDLLPGDRRVACPCADATVAAALDRLLAGTGLGYQARGRRILIAPAPASASPRGEDGLALTGLVVDAEGGRPVAAADVVLTPGDRRGLTTGDGRFVLAGLTPGRYEVQVSALGFQAATVSVELGSSAEPVPIALERAPLELDEIVISPGSFGVLEVNPAASGVAVSREDIEAIPQLGDDAFRTLKRMPGVSTDDVSARLNVRGASDRDLVVRLDGIELYEPYHLRDVDGALGIVDVQSLGSVNLVTGGFPADYGGGMAGVFDMRTRTPPPTGSRTTVSLSLSSLSYNGQGRFAGDRGQWLASLRRGFLQYVLSVSGVDDDLRPTYWDALGKVRYLLSDRHALSAEVLWAGDGLTWRNEDSDAAIGSDWTNGYGWLTWEGDLTPRLRADATVSVGHMSRHRLGDVTDAGREAFSPVSAHIDDRASFDFAGVRQGWEADIAGALLLRAGWEYRASSGQYAYSSRAGYYDVDTDGHIVVRPVAEDHVLTPDGNELGAWTALRGRAPGGVTWEGGLRFDRQSLTGEHQLSPRLLMRWDLDGSTTLRGTWGRYGQAQELHELSIEDGEIRYSDAETADQVALGLERSFGAGVTARVEVYRRGVPRPRPVFVNLSRAVNPLYEVQADRRRLDPDRARARGLEVFVSREGTGRWSWSASYALASSEMRVEDAWIPRTLDQRHTLGLFAAYRLGDRWQVSGTWQLHTGWPYTAQYLDLVVDEGGEGEPTVELVRREFGPLNAQRLPPYHRLDVRVTRGFVVRRSRLEVFLDVFNAYNRTNLRGYEWTLRKRGDLYSVRRETGEEQLPILPTLGFRWVF